MGYGGFSDMISEYMAEEKTYKSKIDYLTKQNDDLREKIRELTGGSKMAFGAADDIQELQRDKSLLQSRINELEEENRLLRETIGGLNYTIRELRARIPDPIVQKTD